MNFGMMIIKNKNIKHKFIGNVKNTHRYFRYFFFSAVICSLLNSSSLAQPSPLHDSWRWRKFSAESGLPSIRVLDLVETNYGVPWANTSLGLAWFNGYFWVPVAGQNGITRHLVNSIVPDDNDSVLVYQNEKLFYGGKKGFREIPVVINNEKKTINSVAYFGNNNYLLVIDSFLYLLHKNKIQSYKKPIELENQKFSSALNTSGGGLWLNGSRGLYRWNGRFWEQKLMASNLSYGIIKIVENKHGIGFLQISTPPIYAGLWTLSPSTKPVQDVKEGLENILAIDVNEDDRAVMVKESDEVKIFNSGKWQVLPLTPEELKNILFIKYRPNGDLWVGTENGLYLHVGSSKLWSIWKFPMPDQRNNINEIIKRKDGSVWCGTGSGLVIYYSDGSIKTIDQIRGQKLGPVTGLIEDNVGNVWISSGYAFDGSFRWDGKNWKHFGVSQGLDAGAIHKIFKDRKERLWFLGLFRKDFETRGVDREPGAYYLDNNKFIHFSTTDGLPSARIYAFAEANDGSYWFGTSAGLCRLKQTSGTSKQGEWKYWTIANGLKSNRIFTIAIDYENHVWFGDQWFGVGHLENDSIKYFTTADGLVSDAVWNIQIGQDNKIWIATRGGLGVYANGSWSDFNVSEGIENSRIWALLPTKDKIYFGTSGGGVQILNLNEISTALPEIKLYTPLVQNSSLLIHWNSYSFWGEQRSENIENRYRVDDQPWSEWNKEQHVIIPDLSSGDHLFSIQSKNDFEKKYSETKSVSFTIPPPLYQVPLFYIPVGFLLLTLGVFGYIYFHRKQEDQKALRKSEEQYRKLFETANDAIIIFDPANRKIIDANQKACELYKLDRDKITGYSLDSFSKDKVYLDDMLKEISYKGRAGKYETTHFVSDGTEIFITTNAAAIEYGGKPAVLSIIHDVTEQRQSEAKLRLLAQTVASTQDYVSITDLNNTILFVNDAFAKAYGYTPEELFGKNISVVVPYDKVKETTEPIYKGTMSGGWNGEIIQQRKDGSIFPVELWTSVVYDDEGNPVALVGVAREISERKRMEQEKENLIQELREALSEVKALSGLLPICSSCKKIRDDHGYWTQVETYITRHSDAVFTHGLCPDCTKEYFPEVYERLKDKKEPPTY